MLDTVVAVALPAGRRVDEFAVGRAGGLLRLDPSEGRAVVDLVVELVVPAAGVGFTAPGGRLAGTPVLLGEPVSMLWSSAALLVLVEAEGLSSDERISPSFSSAGGVSTGASTSIDAILVVRLLPMRRRL